MRLFRATVSLFLVCAAAAATIPAQGRAKPPLKTTDIDAIATLLKLEDARTFDEAALSRIAGSAHPEVRRRAVQSVGRIADKRGAGTAGRRTQGQGRRGCRHRRVVRGTAAGSGRSRVALRIARRERRPTDGSTGSRDCARQDPGTGVSRRTGALPVGDTRRESAGSHRRGGAAVDGTFPSRRRRDLHRSLDIVARCRDPLAHRVGVVSSAQSGRAAASAAAGGRPVRRRPLLGGPRARAVPERGSRTIREAAARCRHAIPTAESEPRLYARSRSMTMTSRLRSC